VKTTRRPWSSKFADAFRGLVRAFRTQPSFFVHVWAAVAVVVAGSVLGVSLVEWCLLAGAIGIVLVAETFNTAIESLARAVDVGRHPRIRDALDMASAGVLLSAMTAAVIGAIVLGHRAGAGIGFW
jgi:diacylglycerol kinase